MRTINSFFPDNSLTLRLTLLVQRGNADSTLCSGFSYDLKVLCKKGRIDEAEPFVLDPRAHFESQKVQRSILKALHDNTTLDEGQAQALCENLSRGLAFTQGPPGTGKTFLGVALAKVLLASQNATKHRPIVVVCMVSESQSLPPTDP